MADLVNIDNADITELIAGNLINTGSARFLNPIYAEIAGSNNINNVATRTTINDSDTLLVSNGSALYRITFANLCNAIQTKINS